MKNQIPILAILILILFQSCLEQYPIENICPCKTTIAELRKLGQLKEVKIENMELGKNCIDTDARFENGKVYKLDNKGIIIQKDDGTECVAKIHLSKDFGIIG